MFSGTGLAGFRLNNWIAARCGFSGCMICTMASPGQESKSLNSQFFVGSMPAVIHTARPDGYPDYFSKRWLAYVGVIMHDVSQWKCRAFFHREVEGIVAKWRACVATGEKIRIRNSRPRGGWGIPLGAPLQGATPRPARQQLPR